MRARDFIEDHPERLLKTTKQDQHGHLVTSSRPSNFEFVHSGRRQSRVWINGGASLRVVCWRSGSTVDNPCAFDLRNNTRIALRYISSLFTMDKSATGK